MSAAGEQSEPAITFEWEITTRHKQRVSLAAYRAELISWFRLDHDVTDQQIVDAVAEESDPPQMLALAMSEWSDHVTECGWDEIDRYDVELHGITAATS